ncbi:MAG TPA: hypothetical protein VIH81_15645 [Roseiarcus sp.]
MGFDIYGKAPTSAEGKYFRRNAWRWPHLVRLLVDLCPEETRGWEGWLYNEGDGLDAVDARNLARRLEELSTQGVIEAYCRDRAKIAEATTELTVRLYPQLEFGPTGVVIPADPKLARDEFLGLCAMLNDTSAVARADVDEFIRFAAASGGFAIW